MFARAVLEETRFLKNRWWEQPRVTAGSSDGGQWTDGGGGGSGARPLRSPAAGPGWARIPVPVQPIVRAAERRDRYGLPHTGGDIVGPTAGGGGGGRRPTSAEPPASAPVGRKGWELPGQSGSNRPATIEGRHYSGHVLDQVQSRGIPPSAVGDAIRIGEKSPGKEPGTIMQFSRPNNLTVITDEATGAVVTTFYGTGRGMSKMATAQDPHVLRMKQAIEDFESGKIDLGKMMADLDDIINDNPSDPVWTQSFLDAWVELEQMYAYALFRGQTRLTPEQSESAEQAVAWMKELIAAKLA